MTQRVWPSTLLPVLLIFVPLGSPSWGSDETSSAPEPKIHYSPDEAYEAAVELLDRLAARRGYVGDLEAVTLELEEVRARLADIRAAGAEDPRLYYLNGRLLAILGKRGDAIQELRTFVRTRLGRNDWNGHRYLGDLLVGSYATLAQASYRKAHALNPSEPTVLYGLSICAYKLGASQESAEWAEKAVVADNRQDIRYLSHFAGMLAKLGRWREAIRESQAALALAVSQLEPTVDAHQRIGSQLALVVEILRAQVGSGGGTSESYVSLADTIGRLADNARMVARFEQIAALERGMESAPSVAIQLSLADLRLAVGQIEQVRVSMERLLEADPKNGAAQALLDRAAGGGQE